MTGIARPNCPECGSSNVTRMGYTWRKRKKIQRWRCEACGRTFSSGVKK